MFFKLEKQQKKGKHMENQNAKLQNRKKQEAR
jgi:hypothetical protein